MWLRFHVDPVWNRHPKFFPAGSSYQVVVDGLIGTEVHWQGMSDSPISVVAGQTADPVTVPMDYVGDDQTPPTATTSPADLTTNIATDTVISIVFSEAVVAASLTGRSIIVSDGADNVTGTLDYNADTYTLTFQPSQDLAVSTTYTITVTTDVMDVAGISLAQNITSNFSTTDIGADEFRDSDGDKIPDYWEIVDKINTINTGNFAIGLTLEPIVEGALKFSNADEDRTHQLILVEE